MLRDLETKKSHVIVKGAGDKAFAAGGDIRDVSKGPFERSKDIGRYTMRNFELVSTFKKPYIAIMDGIYEIHVP